MEEPQATSSSHAVPAAVAAPAAPAAPAAAAADPELLAAIEKQAGVVRQARQACEGPWRHNKDVMKEVRALLSLKYQNPANTDRLFVGRLPGAPIVSIRWSVLTVQGAFTDLQWTWRGVLFVTGQQVLETVRRVTTKKVPEAAPFDALRLVQRVASKDTGDATAAAAAVEEEAPVSAADAERARVEAAKAARALRAAQHADRVKAKRKALAKAKPLDPAAEYGLPLVFPGPVFTDKVLFKLQYVSQEATAAREAKAARRAEEQEREAKVTARRAQEAAEAAAQRKAAAGGGGGGRGRRQGRGRR